MTENKPVLEVKHLNVWYREQNGYRRGKRRQIVKDLSFSINRGEIVSLVGESGSGKSTTARAVLGLVKDVEGEIFHDSKRPQMVFQDPYSSLNPSKRVGWILKEPLRRLTGLSEAEKQSRAEEMLLKVGLKKEFAQRYPSQLSGGQRQRVCIAAALMAEPELLIADEAVSALDVTVQAQIIDLLLKLHQEMGLAVLFISHDLRIVYRISGRVLIMQDGQLVESGSPEEIYFSPREPYTKILLKAAGIWEQ